MKKKKQHYVPQCYLEAWTIPGGKQVNVYDKIKKTNRVNNIEDVAEKNYFYDIDFSKVIKEEKEIYGFDKEHDLSKIGEEQYLENFFAENIEPKYKEFLKKLINFEYQDDITNEEQYFFTTIEKLRFSYFIAIQEIRLKRVRDSINDLVDLLKQAFEGYQLSHEVEQMINVSKEEMPFIHGKMICDEKKIVELARNFAMKNWVLLVNRTNSLFYTSDCPIGTIGHLEKQETIKNGLNSSGTIVYFPISSKVILLMFDEKYSIKNKNFDRRILSTDDLEDIEYFNRYIAVDADRCIISKSNDFNTVNKLLEEDEKIFDKPKTILNYGGKTYYPSNIRK